MPLPSQTTKDSQRWTAQAPSSFSWGGGPGPKVALHAASAFGQEACGTSLCPTAHVLKAFYSPSQGPRKHGQDVAQIRQNQKTIGLVS